MVQLVSRKIEFVRIRDIQLQILFCSINFSKCTSFHLTGALTDNILAKMQYRLNDFAKKQTIFII